MASNATQIFVDLIARDKASKVLTKSALTLGAFGLAATRFATDSVKAYSESEDAVNKLNFAHQKFPKIADVSVQSLDDLSQALQKKTIFDDEATKSAEATLAQFNLTGKQIEQLIPLVQDYAAATGQDLQSATLAVGKAFEGNGRALKAIGINFHATGDTAKDFATIQADLNEKVGGFAEKQGKTAAGAAAILKNQFNELEESVGSALVPTLQTLANVATDVLDVFNALPEPVKQATLLVGGTAVAIGVLLPKLAQAKSAWLALRGASVAAAEGEAIAGAASTVALGPIGLIVGALGIAAGAALLFTHRTKDEVKPLGEVTDALHKSRHAYIAEIQAKQADSILTADNIKTLRASGISIETVTAALGGNRAAQAAVNSALDAAITKHTRVSRVVAGRGGASVVSSLDSAGEAARNLKGQFGGLNAQVAADAAQWAYLHDVVSAASRTLSRAIALGQGSRNAVRDFGGPKAAGGPTRAGTTYLVGENGPELWTSPAAGVVHPANVGGARYGMGDINVYLPAGPYLAGEREVVAWVRKAVQSGQSRGTGGRI